MVGANSPQETHPGVDLAVPIGSDVRATGGGLVREAGQDSAYGLYVLIQHPDGYQSMYGHLSRLLVTRNDAVRAGQVIALSGNTGALDGAASAFRDPPRRKVHRPPHAGAGRTVDMAIFSGSEKKAPATAPGEGGAARRRSGSRSSAPA